ncbi:MAG: hypothetical protein FWC50_11100, partial [Planctomycetaceae bacterium]|nr:hypothetical protein [Planctomycetaceae bacterium]
MPYFDGLLFALASDTLGFWDWGTLIAYFAILLGIAWWVVQQSNKNSKDYFLAGRHTGWFVVGASLYASNIGSEHLVGLAGTGASDGMAMAHYELHAWCLLVLGWIMVPYYERSNIFTMPEFLERRYSPSARWFLSVVSLITYIFTKVSVTLFAGGIVFGALFPVDLFPWVSNFWLGAFGMVVITGLYTILGGLRAVLYTEVMQTGVLLLGAASVLFIGLWQVGGWVPLKEATQGADKMVAYQLTKYNSETGKVEPLKDKAGNTVFVKRFQGIGKYNPDLMDQGLTKSEAIEMNLEERLGMDIDQIGRLYGGGKGGFLTEMEKNEYNSNPPADRRV